jgi:hypothetical protein
MASYVTPGPYRERTPEHRFDRLRLAIGLAMPFLAALVLIVR